ncbi:PspC domain-containing protein, partial [Bombilactobacillus bombi]
MHIPIKRSGTNYVIAGVLGGLADHFDWNANVLRALWV